MNSNLVVLATFLAVAISSDPLEATSAAFIIPPRTHQRTRTRPLSPPRSLIKNFGWTSSVGVCHASLLADDVDVDEEHSTPSRNRGGGVPKITTVEKVQDLLDFLKEDERLCIVKFHASWCKSCQKFGVKFKKLAREHGDLMDPNTEKIQSRGDVRFAQIEFMSNARLCRSLGIKKLPYVHIYRGSEGRLDDFSCGPSKFPMLLEKVNGYLGIEERSDDEAEKEEEDGGFEETMGRGKELGNQIVSDLLEEQQAGKQNKTEVSHHF